MKKILLVFSIFAGIFSARAQEPYFTIDELPDLVKCLPAPPDTTSLDFAHDVMRYMWGKEMRADAQRAAIAERDAIWNLDTLAAIFSEPFRLKIDKEATPEIYKAFISGVRTIELIRIRPKAHFMRKRPFDRFHEHMYTAWEEDELRGEGSYPSGHTIRGWAAALILAQINPSVANELYARGWEYGESRVIVGAHWQSDVDASRPAASIGFSLLQSSPAYREQMEKAHKELVSILTGQILAFGQTHPEGFTVSISSWEEPREGICVAHSATQNSYKKADVNYVVSYALSHGGFVGGWWDTKTKRYYYDSVLLFPEDKMDDALEFGRKNSQAAVYKLSTQEEIRITQ